MWIWSISIFGRKQLTQSHWKVWVRPERYTLTQILLLSMKSFILLHARTQFIDEDPLTYLKVEYLLMPHTNYSTRSWKVTCDSTIPTNPKEKGTHLCIEFTAVYCHCAGRPFRRILLLISSTGQTASRSHQATTCLWLVGNSRSTVWYKLSLRSKYRGKVHAGGEYTDSERLG